MIEIFLSFSQKDYLTAILIFFGAIIYSSVGHGGASSYIAIMSLLGTPTNFIKPIVKNILDLLIKFTKIHIKNQVDSGANLIQIFDSWAGLLEKNDYDKYIYKPTLELVDYVKTLKVPVICFPRGIKDYKNYCEIIKPNAVSIDYDVDPHEIQKLIKIPIQGGLDPKILLTDKDNLKKETNKYLEIFKDHPYIFNLGHGVLPETNPDMVEYLVNIVKDYK